MTLTAPIIDAITKVAADESKWPTPPARKPQVLVKVAGDADGQGAGIVIPGIGHVPQQLLNAILLGAGGAGGLGALAGGDLKTTILLALLGGLGGGAYDYFQNPGRFDEWDTSGERSNDLAPQAASGGGPGFLERAGGGVADAAATSVPYAAGAVGGVGGAAVGAGGNILRTANRGAARNLARQLGSAGGVDRLAASSLSEIFPETGQLPEAQRRRIAQQLGLLHETMDTTRLKPGAVGDLLQRQIMGDAPMGGVPVNRDVLNRLGVDTGAMAKALDLDPKQLAGLSGSYDLGTGRFTGSANLQGPDGTRTLSNLSANMPGHESFDPIRKGFRPFGPEGRTFMPKLRTGLRGAKRLGAVGGIGGVLGGLGLGGLIRGFED